MATLNWDRDIYYIEGAWEWPMSLNKIQELARFRQEIVKFFNDEGFLMGTMYPGGLA